MLRTLEEPIPLIMQTQHRGFVSQIQGRNVVSREALAAQLEERDLQLAHYCVQVRDSGGDPNLDLLDEAHARKILALSVSLLGRSDVTNGSDTESDRKTTI